MPYAGRSSQLQHTHSVPVGMQHHPSGMHRAVHTALMHSRPSHSRAIHFVDDARYNLGRHSSGMVSHITTCCTHTTKGRPSYKYSKGTDHATGHALQKSSTILGESAKSRPTSRSHPSASTVTPRHSAMVCTHPGPLTTCIRL